MSAHRRLPWRAGLVAAIGIALITPVGMAQADPVPPTDPPVQREPRTDTGPADRVAAPTQVIVEYAEGADRSDQSRAVAQTARRTRASLEVDSQLATGAQVVSVTGAAADRVAQELAQNPDVVSAEPNRRVFAAAAPNDPAYPDQWDLKRTQVGLNVEGAWARSTGAKTRVAVLDTGITAHPDLKGRYVGGYDFISDAPYARDGNGRDANASDNGDWLAGTEADRECYDPDDTTPVPSSWHGTHVSGTIAAATNNRYGITAVAPSTTVVPVRVLGMCGGTTADIIDGLVWAAGGTVPGVPANKYPAQVINMSLGIQASCSAAMQSAIDLVVKRGAQVVAAAGNNASDVSTFAPANCRDVVSVAAVGPDNQVAGYSNYGKGITLSAQGGNLDLGDDAGVISTVNLGTTKPSSRYGFAAWDGTSMAAPHVSGSLALALGMNQYLSPRQMRNLLVSGTEKVSGNCSRGCGAGVLDATKMIRQHPRITQLAASSGPVKGGTKVVISGDGLQQATQVTFAGQPGTKLSYSTTTKKLTVYSPKGKAGSATVKVYTPRGNSRPTTASSFRYR